MSNTPQRKVRAWHIANTTVRNPFRLKHGLSALVAAGFEGNMGKSQEIAVAQTLHNSGVINLSPSTKDITSISRKWRGALVKLGFLWPDLETVRRDRDGAQGDVGKPFTLTPNGRRLLASYSIRAEQEVLLRSLAALLLPSPIEPGYKFSPFSPLKHVIGILDAIENKGGEPFVSRLEMASIVILTNADGPVEDIASEILKQRSNYYKSTEKRRFEARTVREIGAAKNMKSGTLYDYQDVTCRYLKSTGIFQSHGRGITLVPEQRKIAMILASRDELELDEVQYLNRLAAGAVLPTDMQQGAVEVLTDLQDVAERWDVSFDTSSYDLSTPEGISVARHNLEELIFLEKEKVYAAGQLSQIEEIIGYLELLATNKPSVEINEKRLAIPRDERPAYFEWIMWRILLALGSLVIPANEVRRFNVDQDFLPIGTAPGRGADVIGVYEDSVLVVEVTLTESSRQEAAEGEPVRRHVAEVLEKYQPLGKEVFGLFVARSVDTNTAETFRIGVWYTKEDERLSLNVVPLTIAQLKAVLEYGRKAGLLKHSLLFETIKKLTQLRERAGGAPEWKRMIARSLDVIVD